MALIPLSEEQRAALGKLIWGTKVPFDPTAHIAKSWIDSVQNGQLLGSPVGAEQQLPGGVIVQKFLRGDHLVIAIYHPDQGAVSWIE